MAPDRRVLGVIRPTVEAVGDLTRTRHVGILGTQGTIRSKATNSKSPSSTPTSSSRDKPARCGCRWWNMGEYASPGADYFVEQRLKDILSRDPQIDTLVLACTHYPLLMDKIVRFLPPHVRVVAQGDYVAASLADYLRRHPEMDEKLTRGGSLRFLTTEDTEKFGESAAVFMPHTEGAVEKIVL